MLTESQARLLRLLARYPDELAEAWDVPRELSLPGLSESLGLVRSALHEPLKALGEQGLIRTRNAHVIGGGNRKRSVFHLTTKGRQQASALVSSSGHSLEVQSIDGLHGRESETAQLESELSEGAVVLTGMPGIGKTALIKTLCPPKRYVAMDPSMDAGSLVAAWLEIDDPPLDLDTQIEMLSQSHTIAVDELQEVHTRHQDGVHALLQGLIDSKVSVIIGVRAPSPFDNAITLSGLDAEASHKLLGDSIDFDTAQAVCEALDGHPLALHLWSPSDTLPEASDAVQAFVEETVLSRLEVTARKDLDTLSAEPRTVKPVYLDDLDLNPLDEAALLRWPNGLVEVQHLVRNVRRVAWEEPEEIHHKAVERWSQIDDVEARWFEAYHRLMAGENPTEFIVQHEPSILAHSAAAATLLDDVLHLLPNAHQLRNMAARLALDRAEFTIAESYLAALDEPNHQLLARLHRSQGNIVAAEKEESLASASVGKAEAAQLHLSRISALIDDRLPDEIGALDEVEKALSNTKIGDLEDQQKRAAIVLMAILKHRISILRGDAESAANVRNDLLELAGGEGPITERLRHVESLVLSEQNSPKRLEAESAMRRLVGRTTEILQRVSLGLTLIQSQARTNPPGALTTLENLQSLPLPMDHPAGRRLDALLWYWKGELEPENRLAFWREAVHRFRRAECPRAARSLTEKLHKSL
ncbi:MAG: hypothetical protein VYA86_05060 [Candidatus Thermoplasmatota archaeon]|nr:hypothetical protein [Candidatus Thermoplasmatota archaeon]